MPSHATPSEAEVASTLSRLELSTKAPAKPAQKPKAKAVAETWDDGLSGSDTETESSDLTSASNLSRSSTKERDSLSPISTLSTTTSADLPNPPPPTPASPTPFDFPDNASYGTRSRGGSATQSPARRPEKTTAVAGRLIAGALGVRAPKRTEEEREYDKATREKERKRRDEERNKEKKEAEAAEERKRSVWED